MLLVWGFKILFKTIGEGQFHCPSCGCDRRYDHRQGRRWFTLFWIPIIPLKAAGMIVQCTVCKQQYNEKVLQLPTSAETATSIGFARRAIAAHMVMVSDNTTVAREAAVAMMRESGMTDYDMAQLDVDRETSDWERVRSWGQHLGSALSPAGAEAMLLAAARVAAADEAITDAERSVINDLGAAFGLTPVHIEGIIASANQAAPRHHG
ncbi:MAG: zinc ribbon domain-containing protein [Ilumatobacteraceae bacterium]